MTIVLNGTTGITTPAITDVSTGNLSYTGTLTGGTGVVNLGSGQVVKDASGNLGLGVTPSAWGGGYKALQVNTGAAIFADAANSYISTNSYLSATGFKYATTNYATYVASEAGKFAWYTAPSGTAGAAITFTQAMMLDASGNLLVGGASLSAPGVAISGAGTYIAINNNASVSGAVFQSFRRSAIEIGSITHVGTTAVLYNTSSDYRLKEVIGAVSGAGDRIDALQPIEYTWKADGSHTRGFLAHKFQEVYPGSVSGEKDAVDEDGKPKYQAMQASTPEVIADLVAELQSLRKRIAILENK